MRRHPKIQVSDRFGMLVVLRFHSCERLTRWTCRCDCGKESVVSDNALKMGNTESCGCRKIVFKGNENFKHGLSRHPLMSVWKAMKNRCSSPRNPRFPHYGGRGITVCAEWMTSPNFIQWALSHGYERGLQLDRIDNDGNYEPSNCRFVTSQQNNSNQGKNVFLAAFGETKTIAQWVRDPRCSVSDDTIHYRLSRGMSVEEAITTPPRLKASA